MKKVILSIAIIILAMSVNAQDFGVDSAKVVPNEKTIFVGDVEHDLQVYETKSGSQFVKQVSSRTGKDYPVWIGMKTEDYYMYEGFNHEIRESKSGKLFILVKSRKGSIYCKYIK